MDGAAGKARLEPMQPPLMIGHEIYRHSSYGGWHPLRIPRVSTVMDLSRALGWLPPGRFRVSPRAKPAAIATFHTPAYIAALQRAEETQFVDAATRERHQIGTHANPVFPEVFRRPATSAGGAMLAGELLARAGTVFAPAAGTHHALADAASGFCYFNDPVLAILSLRRQSLTRIAYVDIDAHHGDGVEIAFRDDPDMLLISIHEENRWPRTGHLEDRGLGQVWNLPVPRGTHDDDYALIREGLILPRIQAFEPEAVVLQCGADGVLEDPQSRMALGNQSHWAVARGLRALTPRLLALGGGGYNPWSVGRLWTGLWGTLAGEEIPDRLPPAARAVLAALVWEGRRTVKVPPEPWVGTLADDWRGGTISEDVRARVGRLEARARVWV